MHSYRADRPLLFSSIFTGGCLSIIAVTPMNYKKKHYTPSQCAISLSCLVLSFRCLEYSGRHFELIHPRQVERALRLDRVVGHLYPSRLPSSTTRKSLLQRHFLARLATC